MVSAKKDHISAEVRGACCTGIATCRLVGRRCALVFGTLSMDSVNLEDPRFAARIFVASATYIATHRFLVANGTQIAVLTFRIGLVTVRGWIAHRGTAHGT